MDTEAPAQFDRSRLPKVSPGEYHLYADRSEIVRLLGMAATAIATARDYAGVVLEETRRMGEASDTTAEWREHAEQVTLDFEGLVLLERTLANAYRKLAADAIAAQQKWYERHGVLITSDERAGFLSPASNAGGVS